MEMNKYNESMFLDSLYVVQEIGFSKIGELHKTGYIYGLIL